MKKNYVIAICDILGFSKLFSDNSQVDLDIILERYLGFLRKSVLHSSSKKEFPNVTPTLSEIRKYSELGIAWFSDTILFYTKTDTENDCRRLLQTIGWLLFENMFSLNTRLRVGISYGEAFMDELNETYIGEPIVEAYQLEKRQKWSGGALTKKVEERFGNYLARLNPMESWVIPFTVPMENGFTERLLAINWTNGIHHAHDWREFRWKKDQAVPSEKDYETQPEVIEKWKNTKEFHSRVCWNCFPELNPNNIIKPPGKFW